MQKHFTVTLKTSNDLYYDEHDFQQYNHGTYCRYTIQSGYFRVYFFSDQVRPLSYGLVH